METLDGKKYRGVNDSTVFLWGDILINLDRGFTGT